MTEYKALSVFFAITTFIFLMLILFLVNKDINKEEATCYPEVRDKIVIQEKIIKVADLDACLNLIRESEDFQKELWNNR